MLISCDKTEVVNSNTPNTRADSTGTEESLPVTPPDDAPIEKPSTDDKPMGITASSIITEQSCYPQLDCGEYFGKEFIASTESEYKIIDTYEELCNATSLGAKFPRSIFDNSFILILYRYEGAEDIGRIGYKDFSYVDNKATITVHTWSADYIDESPQEWKELVYLQIPSEVKPKNNVIGGRLTIEKDETKLYDMAQVQAYNTNHENGTAWLLEANELNDFLTENRIAALNWKKYSSYTDKDYKILALYIETTHPNPIGYGRLYVNENKIDIRREYSVDSIAQSISLFEFVAIPSEEIPISFNDKTQLTIEHFGSYKEIKTGEIRVTQTIKAQELSYQYYEMLDLGVYYYFDQLPSTNAYHVIKSYEELERYVEKPWSLSEADFDENVVLVLKIAKYEPDTAFGIRDVSYSDRSMLRATLDYGRYYVEKDNVQEELSYQEGGNYYYLLAPRSEHDSKYREEKGSLYLTVNSLDNRAQYYAYDYKPNENYQLKPNTSWILTNYFDFGDFLRETGVDLFHHFSYAIDHQNKFVFVYYGELPWHAGFGGFLSNGENAYIDVSYYDNKDTYEPRLFAMEISKDLLHCTGEEVTVHMAEYRQKEAVRRDGVDTFFQAADSFYVDSESNNLTKNPDFEWKLISNNSELLLELAKYTSLTKAPIDIDFENQRVLAYYVVHGCTGCPGANSFGNIKVANNIMFVDNYVKSHSGGEAETSALHFIVIDNLDITEAFNKVVFLSKNSYAYDEDGNIGKRRSEYTTHIISTISVTTGSSLKKRPDFGYKFIESLEDLQAMYEEYTNIEMLDTFESLDFESMCILAVYYEAGSSATVYGGFKDMRVENNRLYIKKYFPQYAGQDSIMGDCAMHPTLHLIAIEKSFTPANIVDVIVTIEPWSSNMDIVYPELPDLIE